MQDLKQRVETILKEWEEIKGEYALPNSTISISDIWTNSYDMALLIEDLTEREEKLMKALNDIKQKCIEMHSCKEYQPYTYKTIAISKIIKGVQEELGIE